MLTGPFINQFARLTETPPAHEVKIMESQGDFSTGSPVSLGPILAYIRIYQNTSKYIRMYITISTLFVKEFV